jgi:hypothetical protein
LHTPAGGTNKWFNFCVPKICDDYMSAQKSTMLINQSDLVEKMNIIAMNLMNTFIYAFNCEGDFIEFEVDMENKTIKFTQKKNVDEFKGD